MFDGKVWQKSIEGIEIINIIWIVFMEELQVYPLHLFSTTCEISNGIDEFLGKFWMLLETIVDIIKATIFALEPFISECY